MTRPPSLESDHDRPPQAQSGPPLPHADGAAARPNSSTATSGSGGIQSAALLPAAIALAAGSLAVLLRPPIPLDETRYLEVLREFERNPGWVLSLNGDLYTDKTPLLFWIAHALHGLGLPVDLSLRILPALCAAGTVLVMARFATRLAAPLAPWLLAALLLPLALTQVLLFDPLLTLAVWSALAAWSAGRDVAAAILGGVALLAKGPVALVFLLPLGWSFAASRPATARGSTWRRALLVVLAALVPVAAWAALATLSRPETGEALWWGKWGQRIGSRAPHTQPFWFYLPILLVGLLPIVPVLFARGLPRRASLARRLAIGLGVALVALSAIHGKQPHYLLPLVPGLALWAGIVLAERPEAERGLKLGGYLQLALVAIALVLGTALGSGYVVERYGELGTELRADPMQIGTLALALLALALAAFVWASPRLTAATRLAVLAAATTSVFVPVHHAADHLVLPARLESALLEHGNSPLATYRNFQAGLYNVLSRRTRLDVLDTREELEAWWLAHPGGLVVAEEEDMGDLEGLDFRVLLRDRLRGKPQVLLASAVGHAAAHEARTLERRAGHRP